MVRSGYGTSETGDRPECSPLFPTIFLAMRQSTERAEPVACDADFQLVADHYACTIEERAEMHRAYMTEPTVAAECFRRLADLIRDARSARTPPGR